MLKIWMTLMSKKKQGGLNQNKKGGEKNNLNRKQGAQ